VPELVPLLVLTLDVGVDLFDRSHVSSKRLASEANSSVVTELREPIFVEPEVVPELVEDRDSDLPFQLGAAVKLLDERSPVDRDRVRPVVPALVETEQVGIVRVLVLDDDGDVLEAAREVGRQRVERAPDVLVEVHQ
jgi:hypothetical protein